jgi:hypothetical protein
MTVNSTDIPEGFEPHFRKSPFTDPWEPLYSKRTDKAVIIGLRLARPHTNARGNVHGGLISALADNAMGYSCAQAMGWASSLATPFVGCFHGDQDATENAGFARRETLVAQLAVKPFGDVVGGAEFGDRVGGARNPGG